MLPTMLAITLLLACITIARTDILSSCTIPNNVFSGIQPLFLQRDASDQITFLYPNNNNGMITILPGKAVYLVCPGETNKFINDILGSNEVKAVCKHNTIFEVNGKEVDITSLTCKEHGEQVGNYINRLSCQPCPTNRLPYDENANIKPVEIGFHTSMGFISTIELCFDTKYRQTLATYMKMSKMIRTVHNTVRAPFQKGIFYRGLNIECAYNFNVQRKVMSTILGKPLAEELLDRHTQFLTRGHLVARSDFVYAEEQRSTFWYVNTAPQWKTFNEGNWNSLEKSVRNFVKNSHLNLNVYTGTNGIMTIEDAEGKQQQIYLQNPKVANSKMYVPKFFWKIIYDPSSKRGTAFVSVNDPFMKSSFTEDVYLCKDISENITWLQWREPNNIKAGISYACEIDDLRQAMWLPPLDVVDILT